MARGWWCGAAPAQTPMLRRPPTRVELRPEDKDEVGCQSVVVAAARSPGARALTPPSRSSTPSARAAPRPSPPPSTPRGLFSPWRPRWWVVVVGWRRGGERPPSGAHPPPPLLSSSPRTARPSSWHPPPRSASASTADMEVWEEGVEKVSAPAPHPPPDAARPSQAMLRAASPRVATCLRHMARRPPRRAVAAAAAGRGVEVTRDGDVVGARPPWFPLTPPPSPLSLGRS